VSTSKPTTTSYAVLALLGVRSWSTYELTRQMDRSVGRFWPRAVSKLYEEPKKLVARGLAAARGEQVGQRGRTVYSITPAGTEALAEWLSEPGNGPVLEFEGLLKVAFAEYGTRSDALATLANTRAWAEERNRENRDAARAYLDERGPFQSRAAQGMLAGAFLTEFYRTVAEWSDWATQQVERWPEDPGRAEPDRDALAEIARRADW
jgi:DNA-binding PadR family transcriptional regulator